MRATPVAATDSLPTEPVVRRIDHVGIVVSDVHVAARYWVERLGLELVHVADVLDGSVRLAYLDIGDTTIQLVAPQRPGPLADHLARHGEGLHHVCFLVDDIGATLRRLDEEPSDRSYAGGRGADVCFIESTPCGVLIELTEPTPAEWSPGSSGHPPRADRPASRRGKR